jgi:hypothetical protein
MDDDVEFSPDVIVTAIFIDCFGFPIYKNANHWSGLVRISADKTTFLTQAQGIQGFEGLSLGSVIW